MNLLPKLAIAATSVVLGATHLTAQDLNIDFGAYYGTPSSTYGAAANKPGTWNTLGLGVATGLLGLSGVPTAAQVTVTADQDDGQADGCTGDGAALLGDNFYRRNQGWSVLISGLVNGRYRLFLYGAYNQAVPTGPMTVNGAQVLGIPGNDCYLIPGATYTMVDVTVTGGTLTIAGEPESVGLGYAGLAALQLVQQKPAHPIRRTLKGTKVEP